MSKKGQTSGLPKASPPPEKKNAKQPRLIKEYHTKAERDAAVQRWLVIGTGIVIAVAALFVVIAVIAAAVTPTQTAATVNSETITVGELQTAVRLERAIRNLQLNQTVAQYRALGASDDQILQFLQSQPPFSTWISESSVPDQIGNTVLNQIIDERLIAGEAAQRGITVDDAALQQRIQDYFGYDPVAALSTPTSTPSPTASPTPLVSPTPTVTPTVTLTPEFTPTASLTPAASSTPSPTPNATEVAQQFTTAREDFFANLRQQTGLGDAEINAMFTREALTRALLASVTEGLSREATFVDTRTIEVDSEVKANDVVAALNAGESFSELAQANSQHASSVRGGELDWQPLSTLAGEFGAAAETALQEAVPGTIVGPIATENGTWVVFQVKGSEPREMTDAEYEQAQNVAFNEFLTNLRDQAAVDLTDNWIGNVPLDPVLSLQAAS